MIIESLSGVRAHDKDMTEDFLKAYAAAFVKKMEATRIVVGRDTRKSGEKIMKTIVEGIRNAGAKVVDIGICPTPTVQFATHYNYAQGGISITASHNPLPWNGLKFINDEGAFLNGNEMKELQELRKEIDLPKPAKKLPEIIEADDAIDVHIKDILNFHYINTDQIKKKKFTVVFDAVNGAAYEAGPKLLKALNCNVIEINCDEKKDFPRTPEPTRDNLKELEKAVKDNKADIGFAVDPDGDRLAIVDDQGKALSEESTLVLAVLLMLKRVISVDREIVTNLSTTMALDKVAEEYDGQVLRTPVGEINVVEQLHESSAIIGGEGNGGIILPFSNRGRDSLSGMALILFLMTLEEKTISDIMKTLPEYVMVKNKVEAKVDNLADEVEKLSEIKEPIDIITDDGVKLKFENSWVHIRKSNTEPIVRVIAEAETKEEAQVLADKFLNYFK